MPPTETTATPPAGADPTQEQKLADMVNGAVKSHLGRTLGKALEDALKPHLTTLDERLAAFKPAAPEAGKEGAGAAAAAIDPAIQARLDALEGQVKKERTAREKLNEERATERKQARDDRAFGELKAGLAGKVRPEAVEMVAKLLRADGRLVVSDAGEIAIKVGDQELELVAGVEAYLKSPEAALFLPAPGYGPGAKGTKPGQRPPARGANGGPPLKESPVQKTQRLLEQATKANPT